MLDAPCKVDDLRDAYGPSPHRTDVVMDALSGPHGIIRMCDLEDARNAINVMIDMLRGTSARLTGSLQ